MGASAAVSDEVAIAVKHEERDGQASCIHRVPDYIKAASPEHFSPKELRLGLYTHSELETASGGLDVFKVAVAETLTRGQGNPSPPGAATSLNDVISSKPWKDLEQDLALDLDRAESAYDAPGRSASQTPRSLLALEALFLCAYLRSILDRNCWGYQFRQIFSDSRFEARRYPLFRDLLVVENQVPMSLLLAVIRHLCKQEASKNRQVVFDTDVDGAAQEALNKMLLHVVVPAVYPFNHGVKLELGRDVLEKHLGKHFSVQSPDALWKQDHILAAAYLAICGGNNPSPPQDDRHGWTRLLSRKGGANKDGSSQPGRAMPRNRFRVPSATRLRKSGVTFKVTESALTLDGIEFRNGTMLLPKLIMNDHTAAQFRNLALYEQLQIKDNARAEFRTYLYLMSSLVDNAEDVRLLANCGIIVNQLGNDEAVSQQWNGMCDGLFIPSNPPEYWVTLQKRLSKHEKAKHNKWFSDFRQRHCTDPLRLLAFLAVCLVTFATVLQAAMAVLAYWWPPSQSKS